MRNNNSKTEQNRKYVRDKSKGSSVAVYGDESMLTNLPFGLSFLGIGGLIALFGKLFHWMFAESGAILPLSQIEDFSDFIITGVLWLITAITDVVACSMLVLGMVVVVCHFIVRLQGRDPNVGTVKVKKFYNLDGEWVTKVTDNRTDEDKLETPIKEYLAQQGIEYEEDKNEQEKE